MRVLVVGAGAVGGYFGGRLRAAGSDVTFLVRPKRAAQIAANGLIIQSGLGDVAVQPPTITADELNDPFDLVLLSCKAYDLDAAMDSFAPAVGPHTVILPLLNGMRHLDLLDARFGAGKLLGGLCQIASTLDSDGRIMHLNEMHLVVFGERDGTRSARVDGIAALMAGAAFESRASDAIMLEMWEKWVFLAALAGITCLMRAAIGDILASGNGDVTLAILEECRSIAEQAGHAPRPAFLERVRGVLTAPGSTLTASMLRDIERNGPTEADHVIGDLLARTAGGPRPPVLSLAYAHLQAYEARRLRQEARP
jgi:2-dehydropantoate 2-reductase